jgi:hypothetical protein
MKLKFLQTFGILSLSLLFAACNGGKNQPNIELMQGMFDQISVKSQDWDPDSKDMSTGRLAPEGTIARGHKPYPYVGDPLGAEKNLVNPFKGDFSPEVVMKGKAKFEIYCMVCHGPEGHGDGPVSVKMALKPPPLISDKVKNFADGRIFHIITEGQGVMGSYASQILKENDRWAVVNYVRTLQKKASSN